MESSPTYIFEISSSFVGNSGMTTTHLATAFASLVGTYGFTYDSAGAAELRLRSRAAL